MTPSDPQLTTNKVDALEQRLMGDDPIEMPEDSFDTITRMIETSRKWIALQDELSEINRKYQEKGMSLQMAHQRLWEIAGGKSISPSASSWTRAFVVVGAVVGFVVGLIFKNLMGLDTDEYFWIPMVGAVFGLILGVVTAVIRIRRFLKLPRDVDPAN